MITAVPTSSIWLYMLYIFRNCSVHFAELDCEKDGLAILNKLIDLYIFILDGQGNVNWVFSQVPAALELEKFVEDVKNGVYPILSRQGDISNREPARPRAVSPDQIDKSEKSETPEPYEVEQRSIINMECQIESAGNDSSALSITLTLKLEDKMNRQLTTELSDDETASAMVDELIKFGLINEKDKEKLMTLIEDEQRSFKARLKETKMNGFDELSQ